LRYLESKLGRYPFDRVGVVVTPSDSATETQTMVTFGQGNFGYGNHDVRRTVVHELAHAWYGDSVTPADWRDLWMNEGMATYLGTRFAAFQHWTTWKSNQHEWAKNDQLYRSLYGPPGNYDRGEFGSENVYSSVALMLDRLRLEVGNPTFDGLVRAWPRSHPNSNQSRRSYIHWVEGRTGKRLGAFFRTWLDSKKSPA
jgi:aminopeptidase N